MPRFCLDTSALLTLRDDEPGAGRVAELLEAPTRCLACFITRMEVLYRVWKDEGKTLAAQSQPASSPRGCLDCGVSP